MYKGTFVFSRAATKKYCDLTLAGQKGKGFDLLKKEIERSLPKGTARVSSYPMWESLRWAGLSGRLCAQYKTVI